MPGTMDHATGMSMTYRVQTGIDPGGERADDRKNTGVGMGVLGRDRFFRQASAVERRRLTAAALAVIQGIERCGNRQIPPFAGFLEWQVRVRRG